MTYKTGEMACRPWHGYWQLVSATVDALPCSGSEGGATRHSVAGERTNKDRRINIGCRPTFCFRETAMTVSAGQSSPGTRQVCKGDPWRPGQHVVSCTIVTDEAVYDIPEMALSVSKLRLVGAPIRRRVSTRPDATVDGIDVKASATEHVSRELGKLVTPISLQLNADASSARAFFEWSFPNGCAVGAARASDPAPHLVRALPQVVILNCGPSDSADSISPLSHDLFRELLTRWPGLFVAAPFDVSIAGVPPVPGAPWRHVSIEGVADTVATGRCLCHGRENESGCSWCVDLPRLHDFATNAAARTSSAPEDVSSLGGAFGRFAVLPVIHPFMVRQVGTSGYPVILVNVDVNPVHGTGATAMRLLSLKDHGRVLEWTESMALPSLAGLAATISDAADAIFTALVVHNGRGATSNGAACHAGPPSAPLIGS